jgi:hypothetical protein
MKQQENLKGMPAVASSQFELRAAQSTAQPAWRIADESAISWPLSAWPACRAAGALHLALPYLVRDYLNDKLADMGDYRGQVTDVDLAWWRGAYQINGLKIVKVDGKVPVPFVNAPLIDLAVSWHSLWYDHAVVARCLSSPRGELRRRRQQAEFPDRPGHRLAPATGKLLPITLNEVRIEDGKLTFRNFNSKPPVNITPPGQRQHLQPDQRGGQKGKRDARFEGKALLLGMPRWKAAPPSTR